MSQYRMCTQTHTDTHTLYINVVNAHVLECLFSLFSHHSLTCDADCIITTSS